MKSLSEQQVSDYRRNGFVFPIPVLTPVEAATNMRNIERLEARIGCQLSAAHKKYRSGSYTYLPWVEALCRHPRVLDAVEDVIGPDILVFWGTFFVKEPGSPAYTAWHQDSTYFGLDPHEHVTAWIALTDAGSDAGCMDVLPPNGKPRQYHHAKANLPNSINAAGQVIVEPLNETGITPMQLKAGEMSMHHTLCPHRSAPNGATHRRIGYGISFIPAHVKPTGSYRLPALLVRGRDHGNFDLTPSPRAEFDDEAVAVGERFYALFFEHYLEQARRHDEQFAPRTGAASAA
ncbi:MAG: phytanoyl-CoA dioxygenase family protein [Betaproteobacteria bacterium]|nr:phytanoyl-CoA dioxygenase family protein [Betaproteobacteria bacterium]